jgi:hypothetical protein
VPEPPVAIELAPSPPPSATPSPSALAREVEDYREAQALAERSPQLALERFQALSQTWRDGALGPEVELRIVEVLLRLGRVAEARARASAFVARNPHGPRSAEMRALAERRGH